MKILYITPAFQHPTMRGPTRHYYFIQELSKRHEITLLSMTNVEIAQQAMEEMSSYTKAIYTFGLNGHSKTAGSQIAGKLPVVGQRAERLLKHRATVAEMRDTFNRLLKEERFDLVLFHGKFLYSMIKSWNNGVPMVADFCDATSMRILSKMRYTGLKKYPFMALRYLQVRKIERKLIAKTPYQAFVSWRDREFALGEHEHARVVPIGVDHEFWSRKSEQTNANRIVFTGVMDYAPNEDAAIYLIDKVLPHLKKTLPDIEVLIVGRSPSAKLQQRAKNHSSVTVTGFVDDVRVYLERASVFAAPMRFGSGVQNKVLEALSMEVPVVTTPIVAAGLKVDGAGEPPVHVAEGDKAFADRVVALLRDKKERARLAAQGREFVQNHFVWHRSALKLEMMCLEAAGMDGKL